MYSKTGWIAGLLLLVPASGLALQEMNSEVLTKIWKIGRGNACSQEMRASFSEAALATLKSQIKDEFDRTALAQIVNPFLFSLGYSHTQLFTNRMESYYLFKSYFAMVDPSAPSAPLLVNPGVQVGSDDRGYFAREVLHGFSARDRGLVKGDRILAVDGVPFSGSWGNKAKSDSVVKIAHRGQIRNLQLVLSELNWSQAFQEATLNSIQVITYKGRRFGYVRLWSGVHPQSADALWAAVRMFNSTQLNGAILDLRGGYGGAFWQHLDPFFADRKDYFEFTATDGNNQTSTMRADPQQNPGAYSGPMAVLIDEDSRSGKEALAYQFKKSNRATVVGVATPGYFSGGGLFFANEPTDYLLYLCVMRDSKLDGIEVEGMGIQPNISVAFDDHNDLRDSQLKAALESLTSVR